MPRKANTSCIQCSKEFYRRPYELELGWGKFCSKKCQAHHNRWKEPANYPLQKKCEVCEKIFTIIDYRNRRKKYCGKSCAVKVNNKKRTGKRYLKRSQPFREKLLEEFGHKCMVPDCEYDTFVDAHHIVAKKDGGLNDPENGILLCPNHHKEADHGLLSQDDLSKYRNANKKL